MICRTSFFSRYDKNGDGSLDFDEWLKLMRGIASRHRDPDDQPREPKERELLKELEQTHGDVDKAYGLLAQLDNRAGRSPNPKIGELARNKRSALVVEDMTPDSRHDSTSRSRHAVSGIAVLGWRPSR